MAFFLFIIIIFVHVLVVFAVNVICNNLPFNCNLIVILIQSVEIASLESIINFLDDNFIFCSKFKIFVLI